MATSDVLNLGQTGLEASGMLTLRLYKREGNLPEVAADASGISITALGNGDYQFTGLPDPGPADRYSLVIALAASPEAALYTYTFGFTPQPPGPDIYSTAPAGFMTSGLPITIRQGSQAPVAAARISGLPANPAGCSGAFALVPAGGGAAVSLTGAVAFSIFPQGGSWELEARFLWSPTDTLAGNLPVGVYIGTFTIALPAAGGTVVTPANSQLTVRVAA